MESGGMKSSRARKMVRVVNTNDIISNLPSNIIDTIIELLPIRDAVRTSVLSKNWKYNWTKVSKLVLDGRFFQSLRAKYKYPSDLHIKKTIYQLLLLHNAPILTFSLIINNLNKFCNPEVYDPQVLSLTDDLNQWLLFLSRKGIKNLVLCLPSYKSAPRLVTLGSQLFSCLRLTRLVLHNCILSPPPSFEGFPNLIMLYLTLVVIIGENKDFISRCCQLERLFILNCSGIANLHLQGTKLTHLCLRRHSDLETVNLNSTRSLTTLSIRFSSTAPQVKSDNVVEVLVAGGVRVPKILPTKMINLTKITLYSIDFEDVGRVSCILCLIQNSPKLFYLTITGIPSLKSDDEQELSPLAEDCDDNNSSSFTNLRMVKIEGLRVLRNEMRLIKSLLAHSPVLEKMSIHPNNGITDDRLLHMLKQLKQFRRASQRARFTFSTDIEHRLLQNSLW